MIDLRAARYTFTAAVVFGLLYGVYVIRGVLFIFTVALMFAYLLYPLVDLVDRRLSSRSRTPALAIVYLILIGTLATLGVTVGSRAADEAKSFSESAPALIKRLQQAPGPSTPRTLQSVKEAVLGELQSYIYKHYNEFISFVPGITLKVLKASTNVLYVVVVPIISFFILKDGRLLREELLGLVEPGKSRAFVDDISQDLHVLLLQYMRSLFTLCLIVLVTFAIVLSVMGAPYPILLACVAFPLEFVPLVGPLVAAGIILSLCILNGYGNLLGVVIFLGSFRVMQDYIISPRLMSRGVELHPLLVIFGVFAGGEIGGIEGIFLSVPVLALLRLVYRRLRLSRISDREVVTSAA
jgi:predicted PurR-regulated permease PerM